jgi:L-2-hydroxyglutarate oxidase LhgO
MAPRTHPGCVQKPRNLMNLQGPRSSTGVDVAVIGAGVVGLAVARALAAAGRLVCVLERHPRAGLDTSTRNSGVIHAGLYYPPGTLKARLSVEGRHQLYAFCRAHAVPHERCGKFVVALDRSGVDELERLRLRGEANGVEGLRVVDRAFVAAREPAVSAEAALWSPDTGIVDADALVKALLRDATAGGAVFLPHTRLVSAEPLDDAIRLQTEREAIDARVVVNAAGLYADRVSATVGGEAFTIYPCRGEYAEFVAARRPAVSALIYPLPDPSGHGLGVHLVRTTAGQVWLGPTIRYQASRDDYDSEREPVERFAAAAGWLAGGVSPSDLRIGGAGIRAKLHPPEESFADFLIRPDRRNPRVVHAAGIDSPGLTSCLAIGDLVSRLVGGVL